MYWATLSPLGISRGGFLLDIAHIVSDYCSERSPSLFQKHPEFQPLNGITDFEYYCIKHVYSVYWCFASLINVLILIL